AGFRVLVASDGKRALQVAQFVRPDVIVLDMMMPVMDGIGFLREYTRRCREDARAPVLAVSTFARYLERARELGAEATLPKPCDERELIESIERLAKGGKMPFSAGR